MKLQAEAHYYAVLGVGKDADDGAIKRAYRAQAKSHHPDLPSNRDKPDADARFKEISEAYEVLSDPRKRLLYDQFGKRGLSDAFRHWEPAAADGTRRRRSTEHSGAENLNTGAGSGVASIFEDLFAAADGAAARPKKGSVWSPGNLDQGPVSETELRAGQRPPAGRASPKRPSPGGAGASPAPSGPAPTAPGAARASGPAAGGRFGPQGFSMSDLKEGLKAAAGYGGMSEGGGDSSDGPAPAWVDSMMGGPVDEGAFARDRGGAMPRFHQQGDAGPAPDAGRWAPTDDDEWVDGSAGPSGWTEPNPASGWVRDNSSPRPEPEPPQDQGPSRRRGGEPVDADFSTPRPDERRRPEARSAQRHGETLHATARIPLLTAIHGGRQSISLRLPDAAGSWSIEAVEITVPPGLEDGGTLRLIGRGHYGDGGGRRGDLVLALQIEPHPLFRLVGRDVLVDLPLKPSEAVGGCRIEVPTLFGTAQVTVPPGVTSGQQVRLRGLGLSPLDARSGKGDQLLTVLIQLPPRLSRKHLMALEAMETESDFAPRGGLWDGA